MGFLAVFALLALAAFLGGLAGGFTGALVVKHRAGCCGHGEAEQARIAWGEPVEQDGKEVGR
jgi:hypothetical protein